MQVVGKTKPIAKPTKTDYIAFFKYHYAKLSREHKRWTTPQLTKVIKLMWQKSKREGKGLRKKDGRLRITKPMTGRRYFRRVKKVSGFEAKMIWRQLPLESKNNYEMQARHIEVQNISNMQGKLKLGSITTKHNLNRMMKSTH